MNQRARFDRLVRPVLDQLYRFALRLTGDGPAAEDLLQASLLRGATAVGQLQHDGAFRVWQSKVIFTTHANRASKRPDHWVPEAEADSNVLAFERPDPEGLAARQQVARRIADALARLPEVQRDAVWLVDGEGFTFAEAAEILGIPPGTASTRVVRGRMALRVSLSDLVKEAR